MDIQLKKGLPEICILKKLEGEVSYGYKLLLDLRDVIDITESTLYPVLRRLESDGFVATSSQEYNGKLRKYFSITQFGLQRLQEAKDDLFSIKNIYNKLFEEEIWKDRNLKKNL